MSKQERTLLEITWGDGRSDVIELSSVRYRMNEGVIEVITPENRLNHRLGCECEACKHSHFTTANPALLPQTADERLNGILPYVEEDDPVEHMASFRARQKFAHADLVSLYPSECKCQACEDSRRMYNAARGSIAEALQKEGVFTVPANEPNPLGVSDIKQSTIDLTGLQRVRSVTEEAEKKFIIGADYAEEPTVICPDHWPNPVTGVCGRCGKP